MMRPMTDVQAEAPAVSRGERVAGLVGLIVVGIIGLMCLDLLTGGWLSGLASPKGKAAGRQGCEGCGDDG